jgi:hypothetical protein
MPGRIAAAARRDPRRFAPVFVLAPPRSFTSVVTTMIGQHPDLAGLPELKLFSFRTIGEMEASLPQYWIERGFTHRSPGLVRALAQFEFGDQTPDSLALARAWLRARAHWSGAQVLDVLLTRLAPRAAIEKSPENVASAPALRRLKSAYPMARYLHLTRHPVTTQISMTEHGNRTVPEHPLGGQPMAGIAAWVDVHARILRFVATLPPHRFMQVRAEDVLNGPVRRVRAIAEWLGLRADDKAIAAMRHPETSPFARPGPTGSGVVGGQDPGFLRDPIPHRVAIPPIVEQPSDWLGEPRLWRTAVELARRPGYDKEPKRRGRPVGEPALRGDRDGALAPDALRAELLRRSGIDQAARASFAGEEADAARLIAMDEENSEWLRTVVDAIGWPGRALVGEEGAHAAWLLAQHADRRLAFQRRCLKLLKQAVARGEASRADLAHLTDRVLLSSGKPQIYGTQLVPREGEYAPARLRRAQTVDSRRAAVGLEPIAAHLGRAIERYGPPSPAQVNCPRCGEPFEMWMPEPGGAARFQCAACGAAGTVRSRARSAEARSAGATRLSV